MIRLGSTRLFVRDLGAAQRLLRDQLGLAQTAGSPQWGYLVFGMPPQQLVVEAVGADAPAEEQALVGRFSGLSFEVDDIDAEVARLCAAGVEFTGLPERQPWGGTLATLRDADGNELQLVQPPADGSATPRASTSEFDPSVAEMEAQVARFAARVPTDDYADAAIPGHERLTYRLLGQRSDAAGAAPLQAEAFHANLVHCGPGKAAPLHNHLTQEVFIPLSGRWQVFWGPRGERWLELEAWDAIAIPPGLSRGFRNVGAEPAWLLGLAAGREPGMIEWPAVVREAAAAAGVKLP